MKIDVGLQMKMGQQLIMTPQLQQAIKLLQLSRYELQQMIDQAMVENPTLEAEMEEEGEESETLDSQDETENPLTEEPEAYNSVDETLPQNEQELTYDKEWQEYVEPPASSSSKHNDESESNPIETLSTYSDSLIEHLFWQLDMANIDQDEFEVAEYIIGNIDDDGYLSLSIRLILASNQRIHDLCREMLKKGRLKISEENLNSPLFDVSHTESKKEIDDYEVASKSKKKIPDFILEENKKQKNERPLWIRPNEIDLKICAAAERVLEKIQTFDPSGVGARNLQECLLLQVRQNGGRNGIEERMLETCMKLLTQKDLKKIARKLHVGLDEAIAAYRNIANLEPKPGRQFSADKNQYIIPDVFVYKRNGEYQIRINEQGLPKLRVSNEYLEMLGKYQRMEETSRKQKNNDEDETNMTFLYLNEKIKAGEWLLKSIDQRQRTIYRVTESIVKNQREFFENGIDSLKPMVLKDVAEDIEVHESTVSRITTNKFMHSPQGIFELKYFFTSGIKQDDGDMISSKKIKDLIKKQIQDENPRKPYTDEQLSVILEKDLSIKVARRTVAKYREALSIMPSNKRKNFF